MTDCDEVRELLPELATGSLTGQERATVLRHLVGCLSCRRELDDLSRVADELLLLAPQQEPSAGFEAAVLDRIRRSAGARPRRRARVTRLVLRAAVLVLVALLGAGAVWQYTAPDRRTADQYRDALNVADGQFLTAAPVMAWGPGSAYRLGNRPAGYVFAYQGTPSWLVVTISAAPTPGRYAVTVVTVNGERRHLGTCVAARTHCALGNTVNVRVSDIQAVRITKPGVQPLIARLR